MDSHFCCFYHDLYYGEDFDSDTEDIELIKSKNTPDDIQFIERFDPSDLVFAHLLRMKTEASTQSIREPSDSLNKAANASVTSSDKESRSLRAKNIDFYVNHLPLFVVPEDFKLTYQCNICFKVFQGKEALGGHTSKKHPMV